MTQVGKICTTMLASSLVLLFGTAVLAEDMLTESTAGPETAGYEEPAVIDREATIEELVRQWGTDNQTAYQLRVTLEYASDEKLTEAWHAESLDEINWILRGKALDGPLTLDDTDEDYVFTPITPCRIADTRNAGGMMTTGSRREFYVYGSGATIGAQGGNAAGCSSPVGEPLGVHVNITAVERISSGGGHLQAFPANMGLPNASILNFMNGQNAIANAASVKTYYSLSWRELEIYASANTHVIIDVLGYYSRPEDTRPEQYITRTETNVAAGANFTIYSPACPSSYRLTGGGWMGQAYTDNPPIGARPAMGANLAIVFGANAADRYLCQGINTAGAARNYRCFSVCGRIPGR